MCTYRIEILTLLFDEVFEEALLIVSLRDDIHQQVVLFPQAINLIVLVLDDGTLAMPSHALFHVLLLRDILLVRVRKGCP